MSTRHLVTISRDGGELIERRIDAPAQGSLPEGVANALGELVAIAGHYKVLEDIPKELRGKAVQIWLDGEELKIAALD